MANRIPFICNALAGEELQAGTYDVLAVSKLFTDRRFGCCTKKGFEPLINCESGEKFQRELYLALKKVQPKDQFIFYFSGHGELKRNHYCLRFGDDRYPFNNLLTCLEIEGISRAIIIIDACHSGAALGSKGNNIIDLENMIIPRGIAVIASSGAIQTSQELSDESASVFTQLFCEGIETGLNGQKTKDNLITIENIISYIRDRLETDPLYSAYKQRPEYRVDKAENGIWIAKNIAQEKPVECEPERLSHESHPGFLSEYSHLNYDRQLLNKHSIADLDEKLIAIFCEQPLAKEELRDNGLLRADKKEHFRILGFSEKERPRVGTFLCFAPRDFLVDKFASCSLHMVAYSGKSRSSSKASLRIIADNLLNLFETGMQFLRNDAGLGRAGHVGTSSRDDLEVPEIALQEALANALVHRDYEKPYLKDQPTRIEVYADRIEITSYGTLMQGISESQLNNNPENIRPLRRNYIISKIFLIMQRVELNASGISRMHEATRKAKLPPPAIKVADPTITVVFYRPTSKLYEIEATNAKSIDIESIDFQSYLQSLVTTHSEWWHLYTLTDVISQANVAQESQSSSIFDFGLMVQTISKVDGIANSELNLLIERLPGLEGMRKYADDHVLLVGRPGSGKSTALRRLLLEEATSFTLNSPVALSPDSSPKIGKGESGRIPVLVELRYWQTSIMGLIQEFLEQHNLILDYTTLSTLLNQGRFLLLIDGLNELPSEEAKTQLAAFQRNHPQVPMIFTTRDLGLGGDLGIEKKIEMQPLTEAQIKDFIRAYVPKQAEVMLRQLNNRLREFCQTPLLLWMLCEVFNQSPQRQMPTNLAEMLRAFTAMYEDSSVRKHEVALLKGDVRPLSDRRLWKEALKSLAALMMQGETSVDFRVAIPRTEAERELSKVFANEKFPARDILDDLLKYHLLQNGSTDQLQFRHQLIQEYYAAEHLLDLLPELSDEQLQRDYLNLLKWTEPLALMLALVDKEDHALRVVKLAMNNVDLMLGARLAGDVKKTFQAKTIGWIDHQAIPIRLKLNCRAASHSETVIPGLFQAFQDQDAGIRKSVVEALGFLGGEATIPCLLEALQDQDWEVRSSAANALGTLGSEAAIPGLLKALQDQNWEGRSSAADALGTLGSEAAIPGLLKALRDQDWEVRWSAADALGTLGSEAAIPGLLEALQNQDWEVRWSAADALGTLGSEAAISGLLKALQNQDWEVRKDVAKALAKVGSEAAIPGLLQALQDQDTRVRSSAADALGTLGSEAALPGLLQALQDQDTGVRSSAADALGTLGSEAALPGLLQALQDQDTRVRGNAAEALGKLGREVAVPSLINALEDRYSYVRRSAAEALAQLGSEAGIPVLLKALKHQDSFARIRAAAALGKIGSEAGIPVLLKTIKHRNHRVRRRAVDALGKLGSEAAIPGLLEALEDPNPSVRRWAVNAMIQLRSEVAISGLLQALEHQDSNVRRSAAHALGDIGSEAAIPGLLNAMENRDSGICRSAAEALGKLGRPAIIIDLWHLNLQQPKNYLNEAISAIQSRYKFYNYEIAQGFTPSKKPISLYFSYASTDEALQVQLNHHLTLLERQGILTSWSSHQILPSAELTQTIHQQLNTADIILLLISAHSLADNNCYDPEIQRAMERHQSGEARVIPILLRPVDWQGAPFSQLPLLPKNHQPVTTWPNQDEAFQEIAAGIREAALELRQNTPAAGLNIRPHLQGDP